MDEAENFRGDAGSFHQQTLSVAMASAAKIFRSWQLPRKAKFLKQAKQFKDDYDNNNYSDYVEDAFLFMLWLITDWFSVVSVYTN